MSILDSRNVTQSASPSDRPPKESPPSPSSPMGHARSSSNGIVSPQPFHPVHQVLPSSAHTEDPFGDDRHPSPSLAYYSPSSHLHEHSASGLSQPAYPSSGLEMDIPIPGESDEVAPPYESLPSVDDASGIGADDENLSTLEKIYLFASSKATFHRVYIAHALESFLPDVVPADATKYVFPLLSGLATDEDDCVREALATELVPIMWWFVTNCRLVDDESPDSDEPTISVQAFTPILGTLLLSPNALIGGPARSAVVDMLRRITQVTAAQETHGYLGKAQCAMFERELLYQVVIGMGRLDMDAHSSSSGVGTEEEDEDDGKPEVWWTAPSTPMDADLIAGQKNVEAMNLNPYFPVLPPLAEEGSTTSLPETSPSPTNLAPPPIHSPSPRSPVSQSPSSAGSSSSPLQPPAPQSSPASSLSSTGNDTPDLSPASQTRASPSPTLSPEPVSPVFDTSLAEPLVQVQGKDSAASGLFGGEYEEGEWTPRQERFAEGSKQVVVEVSDASEVDEETEEVDVGAESEEVDAGEQAAMGRLSSMSLIAAVAASGSLNDETKSAFVREVDRVGRDSIYWVRREASFALGALAKVVPFEIVVSSLLPLFESLCQDEVWNVRHSALFALPGILSRLPFARRRQLAVATILQLARDPSPTVRSGVLEALGEVLYSFHGESNGPPPELVSLFVGKKDGDGRHRWRDGAEVGMDLFAEEPARPLICAFNCPAVALTLGRERWAELRELYVDLARNPHPKVRKTLAASVGEMAKIVGPDYAKKDLLPVWLDALKAEDADVRLKAVECLAPLVGALGAVERKLVMEKLDDAWKDGTLRGWREREVAAQGLGEVAGMMDGLPFIARSLLKSGLGDSFAAVRAAAVSSVPCYYRTFSSHQNVLNDLRGDVRQFAFSSSYRGRNTFVACHQAILLSEGGESIIKDDDFWKTFSVLARDSIIDVRIGVARLLAYIFDKSDTRSRPAVALELVRLLSADSSSEVRSFVSPLLRRPPLSRPSVSSSSTSSSKCGAIFSQPPSATPMS